MYEMSFRVRAVCRWYFLDSFLIIALIMDWIDYRENYCCCHNFGCRLLKLSKFQSLKAGPILECAQWVPSRGGFGGGGHPSRIFPLLCFWLYFSRAKMLFPPSSAVEGIKSVPPVCQLVSSLMAEPFDLGSKMCITIPAPGLPLTWVHLLGEITDKEGTTLEGRQHSVVFTC